MARKLTDAQVLASLKARAQAALEGGSGGKFVDGRLPGVAVYVEGPPEKREVVVRDSRVAP